MRITACQDEECSQESRPGYPLCEDHILRRRARGYGTRPTLHTLLEELVEENDQEQDDPWEEGARGCFLITEVEYIRDRDKGDRVTFWDLESALKVIPDYEGASYWGPLGGCSKDHSYHIYAEVAPLCSWEQPLIALVWFDFYELEDEDGCEGEMLSIEEGASL